MEYQEFAPVPSPVSWNGSNSGSPGSSGGNSSLLVPANPYLNEKIPDWLKVYSNAPTSADHKLKWELFKHAELDCFDAMLSRLFKQELKHVVMSYEMYGAALRREMDKREWNAIMK